MMGTSFEKTLAETWVEGTPTSENADATRQRSRYMAAAEWFLSRYPPPAEPGAWLLVCSPNRSNHWVQIKPRRFVMGRDAGCELKLKSCFASSEHCVIEYDGEDWWLDDLDSKNGVSVNGKRVRRTFLRAGDTIEIGGISLLFHCQCP